MLPQRRARLTRGQKLSIAIAALIALAIPVWMFGGSYLRQRDAALGRAIEAKIEGPPCPSLTKAEFQARKLKIRHLTFYEGVTFGRQFGHMDCSALRYGGGWSTESYPVCQFTSPNVLSVKTPVGEWFYAPGMGQPATIGTPNGVARCVMGGNFTIGAKLSR